MKIPVYIVNRNRLTSTRMLIDWLISAATLHDSLHGLRSNVLSFAREHGMQQMTLDSPRGLILLRKN